MILNLGSLAFNANIETGGGTPAWGTELGQGEGYKFSFEDMSEFLVGMLYKSVPDIDEVTCPLGKGGNQRSDYDFVVASVFDKIFVNGKKVKNARFLLLIVKKIVGDHHVGRRTLKYNPRMSYRGEYMNEDCFSKIASTLGLSEKGAWFVNEILIRNQDELHFNACVLGQKPMSYPTNDDRRKAFIKHLPHLSVWKEQASRPDELSLQQIYFGAPGTSKSTKIENVVGDKKQYRITFHPDTDYASFVGCYKPSMQSGEKICTAEELVAQLKEIKNSGVTYPCHKFAAKYWRSLKDMSAESVKKILVACGFTESMQVEVAKGIAIGQEFLDKKEDGKIVYTFTPQVFTNAYVEAWNTEEDVFLIVEEINRGNCAQIFGDIFQLLDRKEDGSSRFLVDADKDLANYICEHLANSPREIDPEIREGKKLCLPSNLHIWATMNTSDQSLFPIDSAFKRRWDWKYTPIKNAGKGHLIALKDRKYDWWEFLDAVNSRIEKVTESEDKQLGYWFAKPESGVEISAEKFVSKVIFYLWNDVFKDYGHDINSPFVIKLDDGKKKELRFKSFFTEDGEIDERVLVLFFWGLKLNTKSGAAATATEEAQSGQDAGSVAPTEAGNPDNGGNEPQAKNAEEEDTFIDEDEELPEAESIDDFFK